MALAGNIFSWLQITHATTKHYIKAHDSGGSQTKTHRPNLTAITNYPIGPHRTPIYVILPVHITLRPMQSGRPIQTGQLKDIHAKTRCIHTAQQCG